MKIDSGKRLMLKLLGFLTIPFLVFLLMRSSFKYKIFGRIKGTVAPHKKIPAYEVRKNISLPTEGKSVSVETALNSRCNSDYGDDQRVFHWGQFMRDGKLSDEDQDRIVNLAKIPGLITPSTKIIRDKNHLTFVIDNAKNGLDRDFSMIESGIQQQAIGIVCSALGAGMVFQNLTMDGKLINKSQYGTVKIKIGPMKPAYTGGYWSKKEPQDWRPWRTGNLPDPSRSGNNSLIETIQGLQYEFLTGRKSRIEDAAQLLWAARGRVPHLYKSKPWGLTIPFWTDKFNVSKVSLLSNGTLYDYINWEKYRPTHSIRENMILSQKQQRTIEGIFPWVNNIILIHRKDQHARALWEIGYGLLNLLIQARALDVTYKVIFPNDKQQATFNKIGIADVAVIFLI
jgi:hypothetical protein